QDGRSGEIVGLFAFVPSRIHVDGGDVPSVRPFAPIVAKSIRSQLLTLDPRKLPAAQMYRRGIAELAARGHRLSYAIVDPRWTLLLRFSPHLIHQKLPLWSRALPLAGPLPLGHGFEA